MINLIGCKKHQQLKLRNGVIALYERPRNSITHLITEMLGEATLIVDNNGLIHGENDPSDWDVIQILDTSSL